MSEKLRSYHISQLSFFEYTKKGRCYLKESLDLETDILKLIGYLESENCGFEVSQEVKLLLQKIKYNDEKKQEVFELAKRIKNGEIDYKAFSAFDNFLNTLSRNLKPHQKKAAYHLYALKNGANFSVPGSGKTTVVLSVYEKLRIENKCNILFVVGPPSSFQPWQNEFKETLGRRPDAKILSGGNKGFRKSEYYKSPHATSELYLCTFHTVLNDYRDLIKFFNKKGISVFLVVDEAHYIKQIGGSWANSLLQIAEHVQYRCILTGTPIPKSYKDVFNPFDFLWPKQSPLSEADKLQIDLWEKNKKHDLVKSLLNERVGSLFYRVRKKDLNLMEAVFHEPLLVKMNPVEEKIYQLIKSKIYELSKKDFNDNEVLLSKLWRGRMMRLRQTTSYPKLILNAVEGYKEALISNTELADIITCYDELEKPGKLEVLTEKVLYLKKQGLKVLIWSNFIGTLKMIKRHFSDLGLKCELIYGGTPIRREDSKEIGDEKTREDIRDEFVDSDSGLDILIANPAACAESISLHKTCFHAIYYDLSYNCAQYLQSLDRIHRVGGSESKIANYYFLQYEASIDQDIKRSLDLKAQKMYDIIEQDYEIYDLNMFEEEDDDIIAYKRLFKL